MRAKLAEDVTPVTDFRIHSGALLEKIKKTHRPIILTQRGRATAIVEGVKDYEERVERMALLKSILRGVQAAEQGEVVTHEKVLKEMDQLLSE